MMGRQTNDQRQLFYLFNLKDRIPRDHLLRRISPIVMEVLTDLREKLARFYSEIGRPSVDPELMMRMLMVGYCYGNRSERRLCEEVRLHQSGKKLEHFAIGIPVKAANRKKMPKRTRRTAKK